MEPELITKEHAELLELQGWFMIDDFLTSEMAKSLRQEASEAFQQGALKQHRFQFGKKLFEKPKIFEADLHDEHLHVLLPSFVEIFFEERLRERLMQLMPTLELEKGVKSKTVKLQRNGGGAFPCHYDNSGPPSKRSITCLVYLNPDWREGHGGELVLHPFLQPQVVISPLMARAVFFRSDLLLHSVRRAAVERFCFTIWLDGATNGSEDVNLTQKWLQTDEASIQSLKRSPVQRALSRAVYAEEYEASLLACMSGAPGCEELLEGHKEHVARQLQHVQLKPFIDVLRALKADLSSECGEKEVPCHCCQRLSHCRTVKVVLYLLMFNC